MTGAALDGVWGLGLVSRAALDDVQGLGLVSGAALDGVRGPGQPWMQSRASAASSAASVASRAHPGPRARQPYGILEPLQNFHRQLLKIPAFSMQKQYSQRSTQS